MECQAMIEWAVTARVFLGLVGVALVIWALGNSIE